MTGCTFPAPCEGGVIFALGEAGEATSVEIPFLEANTAPPRFDRLDARDAITVATASH